MGAQPDAEAARLVRDPRGIPLELVEVNESAGGREVVDQHQQRVAPDEPQRHRDTEKNTE
jgi:hypothetical protein